MLVQKPLCLHKDNVSCYNMTGLSFSFLDVDKMEMNFTKKKH